MFELVLKIFGGLQKKRVVSFLQNPRLLQQFSAYILTKQRVVRRLAIEEEDDENINAIFFLLLGDAFIKEKAGCGDIFCRLILGYSGSVGKGFFQEKQDYLSEGILKMIAEEFFLPCKTRFLHAKVRNFRELFHSIFSEEDKFESVSTKKAVVEVCFGVLMKLARYQDPQSDKDLNMVENTSQHLSDLYDVIKEESLSLQEFYCFFEHGVIKTLHWVMLSKKTRAYLANKSGFSMIYLVAKRIVYWFRCIS